MGDTAPLELTAAADADGNWSTGEQYIGSAQNETVRVSVSSENAQITAVRHVNFRKLLLYPSGTALFAAIVLLLFFRPPLVAAPKERLVAESEGAETPLP